MKKQVKKITKKILILSLATSLIFTSCFSHKKIEAQAAAATATLSAWTLYEICLYFGGLAVSALGIGYAYENRDEIAEFGKSVIDSMTAIPEQGWFFGSRTEEASTVYGREALVVVQSVGWEVIRRDAQPPDNNDDNNGLDKIAFFLTAAGAQLVKNVIQTIHDKWVNKEEDNILNDQFGLIDGNYFNGFNINSEGNYYGYLEYKINVKEHRKVRNISLKAAYNPSKINLITLPAETR